MATSQLPEIVAAMRAWVLAVNGVSISAPAGEALPDNPAMEVLPLRVITPALERMESKRIQQQTFGTVTGREALWTVQDLMLFVGHATYMNNVHAVETPTLTYIVDYEECVATYRQVISTALIEEFAIQPGLYRFPAGTEQWFYGVLATLKIREIIG